MYNQLPPNLRHNHYILSINGNDQLTAQSTLTTLQQIQATKDSTAVLELVHCDSTSSSITPLSSYCVIFDQIPSTLHWRPVIASSMTEGEYHIMSFF